MDGYPRELFDMIVGDGDVVTVAKFLAYRSRSVQTVRRSSSKRIAIAISMHQEMQEPWCVQARDSI